MFVGLDRLSGLGPTEFARLSILIRARIINMGTIQSCGGVPHDTAFHRVKQRSCVLQGLSSLSTNFGMAGFFYKVIAVLNSAKGYVPKFFNTGKWSKLRFSFPV